MDKNTKVAYRCVKKDHGARKETTKELLSGCGVGGSAPN
jgi:hypothetical protein